MIDIIETKNQPYLKNKHYKLSLSILLGSLLGLYSLIFPYFNLLVSIVLFIIITIFVFLPKEDRTFALKLFCVALILRLSILVFAYSFTSKNGGWFFGDEWGISVYAWQIKDSIKEVGYPAVWQTPPPTSIFVRVPVSLGDYGINGYTYWVSLLYSFFGYVTLLPKIINSILGASSGILSYLIARELFNRRVAVLSMILVTFFPSLIFWSVLNLKDTIFILLSMAILYFLIRFQKSKDPVYLPLLIITIFSESTLRSNMLLIILILVICSYIIMLKKHHRNVLILAFFIGLAIFFFLNKAFFLKELKSWLSLLIIRHTGNINTQGFGYKLLPEQYYSMDADLTTIPFIATLKLFFLGWIYFIFVPFPWAINSLSQLVSLPQMIFWYGLFVFSLIGIYLCIRDKIKISFCLILFIFLMGSIIVFSSGNIGTTFRHRDMLTPFFLIFSAFAIVKLFGKGIIP